MLKPGEKGGWIRGGKCQVLAPDRRQGRAGADGGKAGVKESLFLSHFLLYVFTFITTWVEQLQLVFPSRQYIGTPAKAGKVSDGTVPFWALPSALFHSLTVKTWQHTRPSRSAAVPHPGGPQSRAEQYTYETVHLRRGRARETFDCESLTYVLYIFFHNRECRRRVREEKWYVIRRRGIYGRV